MAGSPSQVAVSEGQGKTIATYNITENSLIKQLQRIVLSDSTGNEITTPGSGIIPVSGNIASATTDTGNPIKIGGRYNAVQIVLSDGQRGDIQLDLNAFLKSTLATLIAGENYANNVLNVEQVVDFSHQTGSNLIKPIQGRFFGWIISSHTNGTLQFWDNTTNATSVMLDTITFPAGPSFWVLPLAINFYTALYVQTGGTINYTVLYK